MKKVVSLVLAVILMVSSISATSASAAVVNDTDNEIQPMYDYISSTSIGLSIEGTSAVCCATISCYSGTTKIVTTMTLQKRGFLSWSDVETWKQMVITEDTIFEKTRTGLSSGSYRLKVKFEVYQGTECETITRYTSTKTL